MIVLNLTLLVQLGLFLLFMVVTQFIVLRPILRVLDAREAKIDGDKHAAQQDGVHAEKLETQHAGEAARLRRAASDKVAQARRTLQDRQNQHMTERRKQADDDVARVRADAQAQVARERKHFDALAPALTALIASQLDVQGGD